MRYIVKKLSFIIILALLITVFIPAQVGATWGPVITVVPDSIDFGSVTVGSSSPEHVVTITNDGNTDLSIYEVSLTGTYTVHFQITDNIPPNTVLQPGESDTVSVQFTPLLPGTKTAYLRIKHDNLWQSTFCVDLCGVGVSPNETDLSISKSDSPDPVVAGHDLTYTIRVTNNGPNAVSDVYGFDMYPTNALSIQSTTPSQGTVSQLLPQWILDILDQEFGITGLPPGYSYITWNVGYLASGAYADLTIVVTVNPEIELPLETPIINRACVVSTSDEPDWDNNIVVVYTSVGPPPTTTPPTTTPPTTTPPTTTPPTTTPPTTTPPTTTTAQVATRYFTVDFLGKITTVEASEDGRPLVDVLAYSPDNAHLLEIEAGTRASDSDGNAVTYITIRQTQVQQLPVNTVLADEAYNITPSGTTFDRSISLSLGLKVEDLPDEFISIGMAYLDPDLGWIHLNSVRNQVAGAESLTSVVDHFTVFAILVQIPEETPIATPTTGPDTQPPPAAASFVLSNLSITTSESKTWKGLTFVARYGEDAEITLDVTNNGGQTGTYQVFLLLNGARVDTATVNVAPGETQHVVFNVTGNEPGIYTVQVGELSGEFESSSWINWWLMAGFAVALILLAWLAFFLIRKRVRGY